MDDFAALDVQIVGVTTDKAETNRKWVARNAVKIPMIADEGYEVAKAFGVKQRLGGAKHTTFLIEADGILRKVYPRVKSKGHAAAVLEDCRGLWGSTWKVLCPLAQYLANN